MAETSGEGSAGGETVEAPPPSLNLSFAQLAALATSVAEHMRNQPGAQPSPISLPGQASGLSPTLPVPTEAGTVASAGKAAFKLGG